VTNIYKNMATTADFKNGLCIDLMENHAALFGFNMLNQKGRCICEG
jgi:hypothetical protein